MCLWGAAPLATPSPHLTLRATLAAYHLRERRDNNSLWLSFTHRAHMLELPWRGRGKNFATAEQIIRNYCRWKTETCVVSVGSTRTPICDVPQWMK